MPITWNANAVGKRGKRGFGPDPTIRANDAVHSRMWLIVGTTQMFTRGHFAPEKMNKFTQFISRPKNGGKERENIVIRMDLGGSVAMENCWCGVVDAIDNSGIC